jgi:hypothetical protein
MPKSHYETSLRARRCPSCSVVFDVGALEECAHLGYLEAKARRWEEDGCAGPGR